MSLKPFVFAIALAAAVPAFAQGVPLSTELADIERQLTEIEAQAARYDGGLILTLIDARREALLLARTLVENRINAEAGAATIEVTIPAVQPDEAQAAQILGEMAAVQHRIEEAEREAASGGGLIQALALSRAETEKLTSAQLQMGYLQAKYGIAFPVMVPRPATSVPAAAPAADTTTPPEGATQTVEWADSRFPAIDYALDPFEQANRDEHRISGWWTIESSRAAVDDSPQVIALNHSQFQANSFMGQTALVARCIEGETALVFVQEDFLMNDFQRNSFEMTLRIDDQPSQQARWNSLTNNKGAGLFGREAETFIRSIYDADRLFLRLVESKGQQHDAQFDLAGSQEAIEAVAGACGWTTLSLSTDDYRAIQTLLNAGGFDVGTPDGQWGPASQTAMRAYQASVGLPETGAPDRATLERLGVNR
ncbi:lytic transglycosylase [Pseudotabrizicola sediminis]|uniref:Lytic transglycosylase n=1 Tax=Pseudotabrizicola sediminis TaxID=2486418 RepID=A0ABY2KHM0_9RHOB|nr:peptidoglycan-binding domain-containing protein [Pseudotabrizicola sediminis]TGD41290.1 lytic transglycosylase [Pseudotabrizicola sediminis]